MNTKIVAALIAIGIYLVILAQNTEVVTVKLFFWEASMSRIILMTITGMIGFIIGYPLGRFSGGRQGESSTSSHKTRPHDNGKCPCSGVGSIFFACLIPSVSDRNVN